MATELAMAMRRLKALETQAREIAELNRKMNLIMDHLGIGTSAPVEEVPAGGDEKAEAEEVPADGEDANSKNQ